VGSGKRKEERGSWEWEVGSGKWKVKSEKWKVGSGKWKVGSGKWKFAARGSASHLRLETCEKAMPLCAICS